jgi:hypothetical protein
LTDLTDRDGSIPSPREELIRVIGMIRQPEKVQLSSIKQTKGSSKSLKIRRIPSQNDVAARSAEEAIRARPRSRRGSLDVFRLTDLTDRDGSISSPREELIRVIGMIRQPDRVQLRLDQQNQRIPQITEDPQNPFSK